MRVLLFLIMAVIPSLGQAQWSSDPDINSWIPNSGEERVPIAASDGKSGVIVAWDDGKGFLDIWANRVDRYGVPRWGINGIRISSSQGIRDVTNVISDGEGGAIIVWDDYTRAWRENPNADFIANEIYVQRVDSTGRVLWDSSGVLIRGKVPNVGKSAFGIITSDYKTYIITFFEGIAYGSSDVALDFYGQKIDLSGKTYWGEGGKRLTLEDNIFNNRHRIVSDGAGGFLLVRFDPNPPRGTILDRYSENGELVWKQDHVNTNAGGAFEACSDGKGGVIVVGVDFPGGGWRTEGRIQRVDKNGRLCWTDSAVVFIKNRGEYLQCRIVQTDNSGAIVSWTDSLGFNPERHFLAFDSTGLIGWRRDGFAYGATSIYHPITLEDGFGNMLMIMNDYLKNEETKEGHQLVLKMDASGKAPWGDEGVLFRHRPYNDWPFSMVGVHDGQGGVIIVWYEAHQNTGYDITLQQISHKGQLGQVTTAVKPWLNPAVVEQLTLWKNYPNPFNPSTSIRFTLPEEGNISLWIYNIQGQRVRKLIEEYRIAGEYTLQWDGKDDLANNAASGTYILYLETPSQKLTSKMLLLR